MPDTHTTACPRNCYSSCSFKVHVDNGKIVHIDPQPLNLATPEGVCIKGLSYVERANSRSRILVPHKKTENGFVPISWDEALEAISVKLLHFRKVHGAQSVLFYAASGMSGMLNGFSTKFWELYGGATTTYGNLCWPAGLEATRLTLGENKHNAPWDLEHAKLIVVWGKNPAETNVQQMIPLEKARAAGAMVVVIDPRRTETSEKADLHVQPKPGTDAALALAIAKLLVTGGKTDTEFIEKYVLGYPAFAETLNAVNLEEAAATTHVPVPVIEYLAELTGGVSPMTIIPGYGMQRYTNGGQTIRTLLALQVITGNIGKKGATWHYANLQSYVFDSVKEPVSYYPKADEGVFRRAISMATLGNDMLAQTNPPLKMAWVERGNPVNQNPDTHKVLEAFSKLEFKVVVEQFFTDTAMEADIVLPAKNMFEQTDIIGGYWNPYIQLKPKVVEPAGEVKPETDIYYLLAQKMGFAQSEIDTKLLKPGDENAVAFLKEQLKRFPELSYEALLEGPQLANSYEEIAFADLKFKTPSGKIELFSEEAHTKWQVPKLPSYKATAENADNSIYPLYFLSPNTKHRIHSQFGNLAVIKQFAPEPFIEMHWQDAEKRGVKNGDKVQVFNSRGSLVLVAQVSGGIKPGCVSVTNGWWAQEGGNTNFLSAQRMTDMGFGTAFHDNMVGVEKD